jgi:hypothetical protein
MSCAARARCGLDSEVDHVVERRSWSNQAGVHGRHQAKRRLVDWIEEVPGVNCQERSQAELLETLKVTLRETFEMNGKDALSAAGSNLLEIKIAV